MNNADFWASIRTIIAEGFSPEGLLKLDSYAEQFISGKLVYQRFSPQEQHGCSAGGTTNVIASLLSGAEAGTDSQDQGTLSDYQRTEPTQHLTSISVTCMMRTSFVPTIQTLSSWLIATFASIHLNFAKEEPEHCQRKCDLCRQ